MNEVLRADRGERRKMKQLRAVLEKKRSKNGC